MTLHPLINLLRRRAHLAFAEKGSRSVAAGSSTWSGPLPELDSQEVQTAIGLLQVWCQLFNEHLGADPDDLSALPALPNAEDSGLGRWIARISQGPQGGHPLLVELDQENHRVHRVALQALDYARSQRLDLASKILNQAFERSRLRVLDILRQLQKREAAQA